MSISFSGLASGLDTTSWVDSLVALKRAKVETLEEEKEATLLSQETLNNVRSFFSSFRSMIEKVTDTKFGVASMDVFAQNLATSSNVGVLTASATSEAEESTYDISVDRLATETKAVTTYSYYTTIVQTTTATMDSKLKDLGVTSGYISVNVNGVENSVQIGENDTISSFIGKLKNVGAEANFNEQTGIFSVNLGVGGITDTDGTGIIEALHLDGVNEGYGTQNRLEEEKTETQYATATTETNLSLLGVSTGTITVNSKGVDYEVTIDENSTVGSFITDLKNHGLNANLDSNGVFSLVDAEITDEGGTGIIDAFGLQTEVHTQTQQTGDLKFETLVTQTTTATENTLMSDLEGGEVIADDGNSTIVIKNSNNELSTITLTTTTTIGDVLDEMNEAGLSATIKPDGTIEISGGTITEEGSFDIVGALELEGEATDAIVMGNVLTETVYTSSTVTGSSRLVEDFGASEGYLKVTNSDNEIYYLKIQSGQTFNDLCDEFATMGINASLNESIGVMSITGATFKTLTDEEVQTLVDSGDIVENDADLIKGSDIINKLFGSEAELEAEATLNASNVQTQQLFGASGGSAVANLNSTLQAIGLTQEGTFVLTHEGESKTIQATRSTSIAELVSAIESHGIQTSWDATTGRLTIFDAEVSGGTSDLADVMGFGSVTTQKYTSSDLVFTQIYDYATASGSTTLGELGLDGSLSESERTVNLYNVKDDLVTTTVVTEATTLDELISFINTNGGSASLTNGDLSITNGYIDNATLEGILGLEMSDVMGTFTVTIGQSTTSDSEIEYEESLPPVTTPSSTTSGTINYDYTTTTTITVGATGTSTTNLTYTENMPAVTTVQKMTTGSLLYEISDETTVQVAQTLASKNAITYQTTTVQTTTTTVGKALTSSEALTYKDPYGGRRDSSEYILDEATREMYSGYYMSIRVHGTNDSYQYDGSYIPEIYLSTYKNLSVNSTLEELWNNISSSYNTQNEGVTWNSSYDYNEYYLSLVSNPDVYASYDYCEITILETPYYGAETITTIRTDAILEYHTASSSTTCSHLGVDVKQYITVNDSATGAQKRIITVYANSTMANIASNLTSAGITTSFSDGKLSIQASDSAYISGMTSTLRSKLKLSSTYSTVTTNTTTATVTATATGTTTLSQIGLSGTYVVTISDGGSVTINGTDTFSNVLTKFSNAGVDATFADGKITLNADASGTYVETAPEEVVNIFSLVESNYTDVVLRPTITNSVATTLESTEALKYTIPASTANATTSTTLSQLGLSGNYTISGVEVSGSDSIGTVVAKLTSAGVTASFSNGVLTIAGPVVDSTKRVANVSSFTAGQTYYVSTADDLIALQNLVSTGVATTGVYFEMTNNIDMSGVSNFTGIGTSSLKYFQGVFDGKGFAVEGLTINTDAHCAGLFGYTYYATIKNVATTDVNITGYISVGGIVGYNYYSRIENCYSDGTVTATSKYAGGITGENRYGTVTNVYTEATVSANGYVGGVTAYNSGLITQSRAAGNVTGTGTTDYVGGFVGYHYDGTISSCASSGTVSSGASTYTGGFVGRDHGYGSENACTTESYSVAVGYTYSLSVSQVATSTLESIYTDEYMGFTEANGWTRDASNNLVLMSPSERALATTSSEIISALGITESNGTMTSGVLMVDVPAQTITATGSTKLSQLGATGSYTLTANTGTQVTIAGSDTIDTLISRLGSAGVSATIAGGKISIGGDAASTNYITDVPNELYNKLKLTETGYSDIVMEGVMIVTVDGSTTLDCLGVNSNQVITLSDGTKITVSGSSTINNIVTDLNSAGVTTSFANGKLVFGETSDTVHISAMDSGLSTALGITVGENQTYTVTPAYTVTHTASNTTTLETLGVTGSSEISFTDGSTITVAKTTTIGDLVTALNQKGVSASYNSITGKFSIGNTSDTISVVDMSSDLETALGIDAKFNTTYTSAEQINHHSTTVTLTSTLNTIGIAMAGSPNQVSKVESFTSGETYFISTTQDLINLQNIVNSGGATSGVIFELTNDINMQGVEFRGIGDATYKFSGTFHGNGYEIQNLTIESEEEKVALFGWGMYCTITDLGVTNCNITGGNYTAGLVGRIYGADIQNCYVTGEITGGNYVGGIVGHIQAAATIANSYTDATIEGSSYVGGLIGYTHSTEINNCFSLGNVTGDSYTGGFIGQNFGSSATGTGNYCNSSACAQSVGDGSLSGLSSTSRAEILTASNLNSIGFTDANGWNVVDGQTPTKNNVSVDIGVTLGNSQNITLSDGSVIGVDGTTTFEEMISALQAKGVSASLTDGKLTLGSPSDSVYISAMDSELKDALNINIGEGYTYQIRTDIKVNTTGMSATSGTPIVYDTLNPASTNIKKMTTGSLLYEISDETTVQVAQTLSSNKALTYTTVTTSISTQTETITVSYTTTGVALSSTIAVGKTSTGYYTIVMTNSEEIYTSQVQMTDISNYGNDADYSWVEDENNTWTVHCRFRRSDGMSYETETLFESYTGVIAEIDLTWNDVINSVVKDYNYGDEAYWDSNKSTLAYVTGGSVYYLEYIAAEDTEGRRVYAEIPPTKTGYGTYTSQTASASSTVSSSYGYNSFSKSYITVYNTGTNSYTTITVTPNSSTPTSIASALTSAGVSTTYTHGYFNIQASTNAYITGMTSTLQSYMKLPSDFTSVTANTQVNTITTTNTITATVTATSSTTLSQVGLSGTYVVTTSDGGSVAINGSDTFSNVLTKFSNAGVDATFADGKITLNADASGTYVETAPEEVVNVFSLVESNYTDVVLRPTITNSVATTLESTEALTYQTTSVQTTTTTTTSTVGTRVTSSYIHHNQPTTETIAASETTLLKDAFDAPSGTKNMYIIVMDSYDVVMIDTGMISVTGITLADLAEYGWNNYYEDGYIRKSSSQSASWNVYFYDSSGSMIGYDTSNTGFFGEEDVYYKTATSSSTMAEIGITSNQYITVENNGTEICITITSSDTIGSVTSKLTSAGVTTSFSNGKFSINASNNAYIKSMSSTLQSKLGMSSATFSSVTTSTTTATTTITTTATATGATTLSQLGATGSYTLTANTGTQVTIAGSDTIDTLISRLGSAGVSATIAGGKISIGGDAASTNYITDVPNELYNKLKLTETGYSDIVMEGVMIVTVDDSTTLDCLGVNSNQVITLSDGTKITVSGSSTINDIVSDLNSAGVTTSFANGKLVFGETTDSVYIESMDSGLSDALDVSVGNNLSYSITPEFTETLTAKNNTTLETLGITSDSEIFFSDGSTITVTKTTTIADLVTSLNNKGVSASYNEATGKFSMGNYSDSIAVTNMSSALETALGIDASYNTTYSTIHVESSSSTIINGNSTLSTIGINSTQNITLSDGSVISVDGNTTINELITALNDKGITASLSNGKITIGDEDDELYIKSMDAGLSSALNLTIGLGNTYQTTTITGSSGQVGENIQIMTPSGSGNGAISTSTKLKDLVDSSGNNLGITSGSIYVVATDGSKTAIEVSENDTINTLANKLSPHGITLSISSEGKLDLSGDATLSTDGLSSDDASNILEKLGIGDENWSEINSITSSPLLADLGMQPISSHTKLVDILDNNGNSLGITAGTYYVFSDGVRKTETITESTTVNDFLATMQKYGFDVRLSNSGIITLSASDNSYLASTNNASGNSNIVDTLFSDWNYTKTYASNTLLSVTTSVENITRDTLLYSLGDGSYEDGYITLVNKGVATNISLTPDATIGTVIDTLELYGFDAMLSNGQLIIYNTGNSYLKDYEGANKKSNALDLLGIAKSNWSNMNTYSTNGAKSITKEELVEQSATEDTLLSDIGVTTGEYFIYSNGVKYTAVINEGDTVGDLLDTLKRFNINSNLIDNGDGTSTIQIIGNGDSYIEKATGTNASNIADVIFSTPSIENKLAAELKTSSIVTSLTAATKETLLSKFDDGALIAAGDLVVKVDDKITTIKITDTDTFGTLIDKLNATGIEATLSDGNLLLQSYEKEFTILSEGTTSSLPATIKLVYSDDLGGFMASTNLVQQTTSQVEQRVVSVSNYADESTQMGLLNITDGTLSIFRDGQKAIVNIDSTQTFGELKAQIAGKFGDVIMELEQDTGLLKFYCSEPGVSVQVGTTTDTSNFSAITGVTTQEDGSVKSIRELYCVNTDSIITDSDLFRLGDVTEGTFTIGDEEFEITATTKLSDIVAQINASEKANATAYWDSIDGKLVLQSRTSGAALINIEAGTSNFTDIMGLTTSEWNPDGSCKVTKINSEKQEVGNNARFSINGTYYTSSSNTVTSDISRIKGLTINLKDITKGGSVSLKIEKDKNTAANAIEDIVESYNELMKNVDKAIATDGQLNDQTTLKMIRNQLRNIMMSADVGATVFKNLSAIGISTSSAAANNISTDNASIIDLKFNKDEFIKAYEADAVAVKELLIGGVNNKGIFTKVEALVESALKGVSGYFDSTNTSYNRQIDRLDSQIDRQNVAIERYRARLEDKFNSMDMLIAKMQQQYSSFLGM